MAHFAQAKVLNRSFHQNPPPPEAFWDDCEMCAADYQHDVANSWVYPSLHRDEPVFLVGFPRSGTTLLDTFLRSLARKSYYEEVRGHKPKGLVIDRLPMNLVYAGEILRVFPRAKFILALRDPADAVLSCFMQSVRLNPPMATLDTPTDAAKTYAFSMGIWQKTVKALAPAVVTTRYEDLSVNPEETLRTILCFLGIEWEGAMLDHQRTA